MDNPVLSTEQLLQSDDESDQELDQDTGRRMLPSRPLPPQTDEYDSVDDEEDIEPSRPSSSQMSWSRGRGKGGHKLSIRNNSLIKEKFTRSEKEDRTQSWKIFLAGFNKEISDILDKNKGQSHLICPDCKKSTTYLGYRRHRTSKACPNMKKEVQRKNWLN